MSVVVSFTEYNWPMRNPDHKPFKHQIETTRQAILNKRFFILNDLGTGKSLSALWACDFLFINKRIKRVLIASPLSTVRAVWANEIFFNFPHRTWGIAHGRGVREQVIASDCEFTIINHDGFVTCERELAAQSFDIVIIDELTAFKNQKTDRWHSANRVCKKARAVWGMTAEPTPNSPIEAYAQAKLVNPYNPKIPPLFSKFKDMTMDMITTHISIPKENAKHHVHEILQPAIRYKRDECVDIPPCQKITMSIELTKAQQDAYKKMRTQLLVEYDQGEITAANAAVKALKLIQIASGWVKDDNGDVLELDSQTRLDELFNIFQNTHQQKLVVFTAFRAAVEGITEFFKSKKVKAAYIHGSVNMTMRGDLIHQFQNSDLQVLVIQPQSTAHGVTLTAADTIVWHTIVPSGEIHNQANGRITRIGQARKQTIYYFEGCAAERRILSIVDGKDSMSKGVLSMFETQEI